MKRTPLFLTALALLLATASFADDRKEIVALYEKLRQAIVNNKPEATLALETPDFLSINPNGTTMTGKELAAQMKQEAAGAKPKEMTITVKKVFVKGKTATVFTEFSFTSEIVDTAGQMGKKGAKHRMSASGGIKNTLEKTEKGWKFKTMESLSQSMKMDGKPFDPSKMGSPPPPEKK